MDEAPDVVGEASIEYEENDSDAVATYTAADPEGAEIVWSLGGDGAALFSIEGGVLTFKKSPNFEMAADMDGDNMYSVTVQATDETGKMGTKEVTVEVTDVDEAPDVVGEASIEYEENDSDAVATYTAADPEGAEIVWSLGGDGAALFSIEGGVLSFRSAPDFEMAADMDGDNVYQVTVEASDGTYMGGLDVTVTVTDVDEATVGDTLLARYDEDKSGMIEKREVLRAIDDYLFGGGDEAISKTEVLEVIDLYLFPS